MSFFTSAYLGSALRENEHRASERAWSLFEVTQSHRPGEKFGSGTGRRHEEDGQVDGARWFLCLGEITEHLWPVEERCNPRRAARQALCVTKILRGSGGRSRTRMLGFKGPRPAVERHLIKRVAGARTLRPG